MKDKKKFKWTAPKALIVLGLILAFGVGLFLFVVWALIQFIKFSIGG